MRLTNFYLYVTAATGGLVLTILAQAIYSTMMGASLEASIILMLSLVTFPIGCWLGYLVGDRFRSRGE